MNRIPLTERLLHIDAATVIKDRDIDMLYEMANTPIARYLAPFEGELERLTALLGLSPDSLSSLRYRNVAAIIAQKRYGLDVADEAVKILALPFKRYIEERTKLK